MKVKCPYCNQANTVELEDTCDTELTGDGWFITNNCGTCHNCERQLFWRNYYQLRPDLTTFQ